MRNNHTLLLLLEDTYMNFKKSYAVHQTITIAYTLVCLDSGSLTYVKEVDSFFASYEKKNNLTELLVYQASTILLKNPEFSEANITEYLTIYKKFIEQNQVKPKQIKHLLNEIKNRLKIVESKRSKESQIELRKFLEDYIKDLSAKFNFFKFSKFKTY